MSFIFLIGYAASFGSGINSQFSVSDIFSISLSDMFFIYAVSLFLPILLNYNHLMPDYEHPLDKARREENFEYIQKFDRDKRFIVLTSAIVFTFWIAFILVDLFLGIYFNQSIPYYAIQFFGILFTPIYYYYIRDRLIYSPKRDLILTVIVGFLAASLSYGLSRGQSERRLDFNNFDDKIGCGEFKILRSVSDRFIAIDRKNHRFIIDNECKVIFIVPYKEPFSEEPRIKFLKHLIHDIFN